MDLPFHNRLAFTGEVPALLSQLLLRAIPSVAIHRCHPSVAIHRLQLPITLAPGLWSDSPAHAQVEFREEMGDQFLDFKAKLIATR